MTSDINQLLVNACGTGEIITLCYNGGTHPGKTRKVILRALHDDRLIASEQGNPIPKTFKRAKIAWVELSDGTRADNSMVIPVPPASDIPPLSSLDQYADMFSKELEAAGWTIVREDQHFEVRGVSAYYKTGRPKIRESVSICKNESSFSRMVVDRGGNINDEPKEVTGYEKPWSVSWGPQSRNFGKIEKAFPLFMEKARVAATSLVKPPQ